MPQPQRRRGVRRIRGPPYYMLPLPHLRLQHLSPNCPTLTANLCPFFRRLAQIQKTYSAAWRDLDSLCEIKAGDAYWPIMKGSLDISKVARDTTYESGVEFCEQIKCWAQSRLADQAVSIQDLTQDKAESVEKYQVRLLQVFYDLGFDIHNKSHSQMLSSSFVNGNTSRRV
ncbi:hypothetical protein XELAEV_18033288mg [Xenopus laevis]|uniref:Uncharacterized protein n=1 Tax=Xenopus laevis TaxID=8355 RepID=A0A974CK32_XENLA|nr:hypothetical protein XELAEV_18033288mg [Xenopus laevis]